MNRIPSLLLLCIALVWVSSAAGQTPYKLPSKDVVAILDAPPPPLGILSPTRDTLLLIEIQPNPSIEVVAEPILRLAGLRINPRVGGLQRLVHYTGLNLQPLDGSPGKQISNFNSERIVDFHWSLDGGKVGMIRGHSDSDVVLLRDSEK